MEKSNLDRRAILGAALELADEEGLGAVSMRRIALRLGVGTMSLYYYVPNKEDLLTGMVDLAFEGVDQPPDDLQEWSERLVFVSRSFRRAALAHPVLTTLLVSGYINGPVVLRSTDAYLEAIVGRGFEAEVAARIYRSAASYIVGFLSLELGGYFAAIEESYRRMGHLRSEQGYPGFTGVGLHLASGDPDLEFEAGLRTLLEGFRR